MRLFTKPKDCTMCFSNTSNLILYSTLKNQIGTASQGIVSCIYFGIYRKAERRISLEKKDTESKNRPDFETAGT